MQCKVDMSYPEIKVEKQDVSLAADLYNLYAGEISEDTCIHSYIYQMLMLEENHEIKKILKGVAIVEMHHLEILGTLIKKLGFIPSYVGIKENKPVWFSSSYIRYLRDIKSMLLHNIKQEQLAITHYEEVIKKTNDPFLIPILKRIILDERLHVEIFTKLYQQMI